MGKWKDVVYKLPNGQKLIDWAIENNIHYSVVWSHITRKGLSVEDACKRALERKGRKDCSAKYMVGDVSVKQWCVENGFKPYLVYSRIHRGFSVEESVRQVKELDK